MRKQDILVIGTDTGVGKTVVTCRLLEQLRQAGINAVGMKPVASGMVERDGQWINEDVEAICRVTGQVADRAIMNPYVFRPFIAPHLAAHAAGQLISLDKIEGCYRQLSEQADLVIVEGAGGLMTPLNEQETFMDLADRLSLSVVLVVAIRLGCINHALLTALALQARKIPLVGWVANYPEGMNGRDHDVEATLKSLLPAPCASIIPHGLQSIENTNIDISHVLNF